MSRRNRLAHEQDERLVHEQASTEQGSPVNVPAHKMDMHGSRYGVTFWILQF